MLLPTRRYTLRLSSVVLASLLTACGGSSDSTSSPDGEVDVTLTGSIGDGPVIGATVSILDNQGRVLRSETSDANANYRIRVKARRASYPLRIEASGGMDVVTGAAPDFLLRAVSSAPSESRVNINPYTTIATGLAEYLPGGLLPDNIDSAEEIVLNALNFGLDTSLVPSPLTSKIDESNGAAMIKASEAFGEMLRRVRDAMTAIGEPIDADQVIHAIASDLVDGVLDGVGATATDPRVAALAAVATAEVLLESLRNELRVGGTNATVALDTAVKTSFPSVSEMSPTERVAITAAVLSQTITSVKAAEAFANTDFSILLGQLNGLVPGNFPADARSTLTYQIGSAFQNTLAALAIASDDQIEAVNAVMRGAGNDDVDSGSDTGSDTSSDGNSGTDSGDSGTDPSSGAGSDTGTGSGDNTDSGDSGTDPSSDTGDDTDSGTVSDSHAQILYSTSGDLSNPAPLAGATLAGQVQMFLNAPEEWEARGIQKVVFYCCKGGVDAHAVYPADTSAPYSINVDLSQYAAGTQRELYADVFLADQYGPESLTVNFTIGTGTPSVPSDPTVPSVSGAATLSWMPPTRNTDGSSLTDLAGYKIYYGTASGSYTKVVDVPVSVTEFTVDSLSPSTYYFVITAYNAKGVESTYSNIATKTVQ